MTTLEDAAALRLRTRITAWVFGIWGIVADVSMPGSTAVRSEADRIALIACGSIITALWFVLLARRAWAWRGILLVLPVQLLAILHNAAGLPFMSGACGWFFWTIIGVITMAMMGWQVFVLLTDPPRNWLSDAAPSDQGAKH